MNEATTQPVAVVMVFGGEVIQGQLRGTNTLIRCDSAYELACRLEDLGYKVVVGVSGGRDHAGQSQATGTLMAESFQTRERRFTLVVEPRALETYSNIRKLRKALGQHGYWRGTRKFVVSERCHTRRIVWSFVTIAWFTLVEPYPTPEILTAKKRAEEDRNFWVHFFDWWGVLAWCMGIKRHLVASRH